MDERKEKDGVLPEAEETSSAAQALHDELEDLAKVFQEELDRAKAEAREVAENGTEEPEILIQGLEDLTEHPAHTESVTEEAVPEEELCECCGEKRRGTAQNPNSAFCEECDAGLRHYPFDWVHVLLAFAAICLVFFGGYVFAERTEGFAAVCKAEKLQRENKMYSALDAYADAASKLESRKINAENVYKREILLAASLGFINGIEEPAQNIQAFEMSFPHFREVKRALQSGAEFTETVSAAEELLVPYQTVSPDQIPYDDLLAKLEAMKTQIVPEAADGGQAVSQKGYQAKAEKYSVPGVLFYQYYLALLCEKSPEVQIGFLEEIQETAPQALWLYGQFLGELYAKTGRDAEPLCKRLEENNAEDGAPALIRVISMRIQKNYDAAIALCETQIDAGNENSSELYRQMGLCYLLMGDYKSAYTAVNNGFQSSSRPSIQTCNTLALCALAAEESEAFGEVKELLENSGITLSAEVTQYQNGTLTIEQIFTEGDCDVT